MADIRRQKIGKRKNKGGGFARVTNDYRTNKSMEILGAVFNDQQQQIDDLSVAQKRDKITTIGAPTPAIPCVIAVRYDVDDVYPTCKFFIDGNTQTLRVLTLRRSNNKKKSADADDAAAIARAKADADGRGKFEIEVTEAEAANGVVEREIGPFKKQKAKDSTDAEQDRNRIQIIRLIGLDDKGAKQKNPATDPTDVAPPISGLPTNPYLFPALIVDTGSKDYFSLTDALPGAGPSAPDGSLIVCNQVNLETTAATAKVTFKIWASGLNTGIGTDKTFEDMGVNRAHIVLQRLNQDGSADSGSGSAADEPLKFGGPITDPTATFVLIDAVLPLFSNYSWKKNVTGNGTSNQEAVPASPVKFYAGGNNVPSQLASFTIAATPQNVHHTLLTITIVQPGSMAMPCASPAVLMKRLEIYESTDGGATYGATPVKKVHLLDQEGFFVPGFTIVLTRKVKHKARISTLFYKARVVGLGTNPPTRDSAGVSVNSNYLGAPPDPLAADLIENIPDGNKKKHRARVACRVWSTADAQAGMGANVNTTFRTLQADHAFVRFRRLKDTHDAQTAPDESTTQPIHHKHYGGPIPDEDLDKTSTIIAVHNLRLGDEYIWDLNKLVEHGIAAKSPGAASVSFEAGYGTVTGSGDPTRLQLLAPAVTRINKRHSLVKCEFDQTDGSGNALNPPVLVRDLELWQQLPSDTSAIKIRDRALLKAKFSENDPSLTYPAPDTAKQKFVHFKVHHPPNVTGITYFYVIRTETDATAQSPTATDTSTGNDEPPAVSTPTGPDIQSNMIVGDMSHTKPIVVLRVYSSQKRDTATFKSLNIDAVHVVIDDNGGSGDKYKFGGPLADGGVSFIDITCHGLALAHHYTWTKSIGSNGAGHTPALSTTTGSDYPAGTSFYAGGKTGSAGLTELGTIQLTVTPINETHSKVTATFAQPSTPILLRAAKLEVQITKSPNGYTDASYVVDKRHRLLDDETFQVAGPQEIDFRFKHPRACSGSVQVTVIGVGEGHPSQVVNTTFTSQDISLSPPSASPSAPTANSTFIPINQVQSTHSALQARVALRVYANGGDTTKKFSDVGADHAYVLLQAHNDDSNKRHKFGGPIHDTTQNYIDIECTGLQLGKEYDWTESITTRNGTPAIAQPSAKVSFYAGAVAIASVSTYFASSTGAGSIKYGTIVTRDVRHSIVPVIIQQTTTGPAGSDGSHLPVLLKKLKLQVTITDSNSVAQPVFTLTERLLDDPESLQSSANTINFVVKHKKGDSVTSIKAILVGADDSTQSPGTDATLTIANSGEFEDGGVPGSIGTPKLKWNQNGLRMVFSLDTTNMNTHYKCAVVLLLSSGSKAYLWSPQGFSTETGTETPHTVNVSGQSLPLDTFPTSQYNQYLIEVGKNGHVNFNVPANPVQQASIDGGDSTIFNAINNNGGSLTIYVYLYNRQGFIYANKNNGISFSIGAGWTVATA